MASNYTGNPSGVQSPDTGYAPGHAPVLSVPAGTDFLSIESISQWAHLSADYFAVYGKLLNGTLPTAGGSAPQLKLLDAAGNARFAFDSNGYPVGAREGQHIERWQTPLATLINGQISGSNWTCQLGTASAVAVEDPTTAYNNKFLQISPSSSSGGETYLYGPTLCIANTSFMSLVMEFEVGMNAALAGTSSKATLFVGLSSRSDPFSGGTWDPSCVALMKPFGNANWNTATGAGGLVNITPTAAAPSSGAVPLDRVKIEIQGSATAAGAYQALFRVNGSLIATIAAAALPGATTLRPSISLASEGGAPVGSPLAYVGPIRCYWNVYANADTL